MKRESKLLLGGCLAVGTAALLVWRFRSPASEVALPATFSPPSPSPKALPPQLSVMGATEVLERLAHCRASIDVIRSDPSGRVFEVPATLDSWEPEPQGPAAPWPPAASAAGWAVRAARAGYDILIDKSFLVVGTPYAPATKIIAILPALTHTHAAPVAGPIGDGKEYLLLMQAEPVPTGHFP